MLPSHNKENKALNEIERKEKNIKKILIYSLLTIHYLIIFLIFIIPSIHLNSTLSPQSPILSYSSPFFLLITFVFLFRIVWFIAFFLRFLILLFSRWLNTLVTAFFFFVVLNITFTNKCTKVISNVHIFHNTELQSVFKHDQGISNSR